MTIESVASWAKKRNYRYMLFGDEVMDLLPDGFTVKCSNRIQIMIDPAKLLTIRQLFEEGAEQVIWFDADLLIFSPGALRCGPYVRAGGRSGNLGFQNKSWKVESP